MEMEKYETLEITQRNSSSSRVFDLYLNRPSSLNALSREFFDEFPKALHSLDRNPNVGVIVLSGKGEHFCSGIDLNTFANNEYSTDRGRTGELLRRNIIHFQDAITAIERCRKPVIAAVHGACIGGGVDIITACDIRYCTEKAFFSVKEVDLAITADLGSLQRLPAIVGYANAMELALTARRFSGVEAKSLGLVSQAFTSKQAMDSAVDIIAQDIALKSPLAVIGTKAVLQKSRDLTIEQGLDYVATWNSGTLLSDDLTEAISAYKQKRPASFSKL